MSGASPAMDRETMRQQVMARLRHLAAQHGNRWEWGGQIRFFFGDCGLEKPEVDQELRMAFQRRMHQLWPLGQYDLKVAGEGIDSLIEIVHEYHARAMAQARLRQAEASARDEA